MSESNGKGWILCQLPLGFGRRTRIRKTSGTVGGVATFADSGATAPRDAVAILRCRSQYYIVAVLRFFRCKSIKYDAKTLNIATINNYGSTRCATVCKSSSSIDAYYSCVNWIVKHIAMGNKWGIKSLNVSARTTSILKTAENDRIKD